MDQACRRTCGETIFAVGDGLVSAAILLCSAISAPLVLAQVPPGDHCPGQCRCRLSDVVTARPYRQRVPVRRLIPTSRQARELSLPCDTPDDPGTSRVGATPDQAQVLQRPMDPPHRDGPTWATPDWCDPPSATFLTGTGLTVASVPGFVPRWRAGAAPTGSSRAHAARHGGLVGPSFGSSAGSFSHSPRGARIVGCHRRSLRSTYVSCQDRLTSSLSRQAPRCTRRR